MFSTFWQAGRRKPTPQHGRRPRAAKARFHGYRPHLELFEDRVVLSTIHWINPDGGTWENPSNWSGGVVPGSDDDVIIDVPGSITIAHDTGADTVHSLTSQQSLLITGGSALAVTDTFTESAMDLLVVDQASTFTANGASTIDGVSLFALNGSTLNLPGATAYHAQDAAFSPTIQADGNGSQLNLAGLTTLQGAGNASDADFVTVLASNGGQIDLSQLAQVTAGNTHLIASANGQIKLAALTSFTGAAPGGASALVASDGGTLSLTSDTLTVANVNVVVDPTGTIKAGTLALTDGSLLTGLGTITANVQNDAEVRPALDTDIILITGDYTQTTGTVTGQGTLGVTGLLTWAGGSMTGSGPVNALGGWTLSGDADKVLDGRTLNDAGAGRWTGLGNLVVGDGGVVNLLAAASLDIQNDQAILNTLGGDATVNNLGFIGKSSGSGTTSIQVAFNNGGTIGVASGTLSLTGTFDNFADGTLTGGAYLVAGTLQFTGAALTTNAAVIALDGASARIVDENGQDALANLHSNSGTLMLQNGRNLSVGDFSDTGSLTVGADSTLTINGTYTESGTLTVLAQGTVQVVGSFSNFSDGTLTGGTYLLAGTLRFPGANIVTNAATIELDGTASQIVDESGNDALAHLGSTASTGNLTLQFSRTFIVSGDFNNAGSLTVGMGSLFAVAGTYTQTGTLTITDLGAVELFGGGSADGTINNAGTLNIDKGSSFTVTAPLALTGTVFVQTGATLTLAGGSSNTGNLVVLGSVVIGGDFANSGTVALLDGSNLTVQGNYTQTDGNTALSNATLTATGLVDLQGGILAGTGTLAASVRNAGRVDVGGSGLAGLLTITGDYTQTANGVLNIEVGGGSAGTSFDQLAIGGTATLDGTLNVTLLGGFVPTSGDTFSILTFATLQGSFATTNLDASFANPPSYDAADVAVQAV